MFCSPLLITLADGVSHHITQLAEIAQCTPQQLNSIWQNMPTHIRPLLRQQDGGFWKLAKPLALLPENFAHKQFQISVLPQTTSSNDVLLDKIRAGENIHKQIIAVHQQTAAEVIYNRVNSEKPMIGMTNFKGDYITKADTHIAKNYLKEDELNILNLLVSRFLDYAELQAISEKAMTMNNWKERLDMELKSVGREILLDNGKISHEEAIKKADTEYDKYRQKEFENYESDFDRAVEELTKEAKRIRENKDEAKI